MALLKKIKNGNSEIEIYDSDLTEEERKNNLISLYKTINKIADVQRQKGINVNNWFYTSEELKKMKDSGKYNFL